MRPSRLQEVYQRNISTAMLLVLFLSLICGWFIRTLDGPSGKTLTAGSGGFITGEDETPKQVSGKVKMAGLWQPYAEVHEGFLGFLRLDEHLADQALPEMTFRKYSIKPAAPAVPEFPEMAVSEIEGTSPTGMYGTNDFNGTGVGTDFGKDEQQLLNSEITVIIKQDPEYPFVARDNNKEGRVTLLIYIDEKGDPAVFPSDIVSGKHAIRTKRFISDDRKKDSLNYVIVSEEPRDYFFAYNVVKVLPTWKFSPKIERGIPTASFLLVTYNFCLGLNCLKLELSQVKR